MTTYEPANEAYFERERKLKEQLEEGYPEAWKPEQPGETMIGVFRGRDTGHTPYGPKWIALLEDRQGKRWAVWLLHTALENQFRRAQPAIGEMVAIRYEGKATAQDGKTQYDNWTVRVDRPDATRIDWDAPAPGAPPPPPSPGPGAPVADAEGPPPYQDDDIPF